MLTKVYRSGDDIVVAIPEELLEAVHLSEGEEVSVELDLSQQQILVRPSNAGKWEIDPRFAKQVDEFIEEYRPALEALAN